MSIIEGAFAPLKSLSIASLVARYKQWRADVNERQRIELEKERHEKERRDEEERERNRLRPIVFDNGMQLPITGDIVAKKHINGIAVRLGKDGPEVAVSTPAREFIIPCSSQEEAEKVRRNVARGSNLLRIVTIAY